MKLFSNHTLVKKLRSWHRDLGFLMVGICLVYAISGVLLNHMGDKDPAFKTEKKSLRLESNLAQEKLETDWNGRKELPPLRKIIPGDEEHSQLILEGGVGTYNHRTGEVAYEKYTKRKLVYWINRLHYSKVKGWNVMADFFAASLLFFAISGLVMVKGKYGISGRGKWLLILGLLIPVGYVLLA